MTSPEDPLTHRVRASLGVIARPAAAIADDLGASRRDVRRVLEQLVVAGIAERVGVGFRRASSTASREDNMRSGRRVSGDDSPRGIDLLRAILKFHADIQEELASSKLSFDPSDPDDCKALQQGVRLPIDWHSLDVQGEVRVPNAGLPPGLRATSHAKRFYFCGPLELVERDRRGAVERRWMPVFVLPVVAANEQHGIRFARAGDVRINLDWLDAQSRDAEEKVDLQVRLGLIEHSEIPDKPRSLKTGSLGRCWADLLKMFGPMGQVEGRICEPNGPLDPPPPRELPIHGSSGLYGRCILIREELSSFSKGLVEDLRIIAAKPEADLMRSALSMLLNHERMARVPAGLGDGPHLHEVPLNGSQRCAVAGAMRDPVTVVQGPPGTGKSTTVRAAMLTVAAHRGSVLFSSTNHRAVDAVTEEWNKRFPDRQRLVADLRPTDGVAPRWTSIFLANLAAGKTGDDQLGPLLSELSAMHERESALEVSLAAEVALRDEIAEVVDQIQKLRQSDCANLLHIAEKRFDQTAVGVVRRLLCYGQRPWWDPRRWLSAPARRRFLASLKESVGRSDAFSLAEALVIVECCERLQCLRQLEEKARAGADIDKLNMDLNDLQAQRLAMIQEHIMRLPGQFARRAEAEERGVTAIHRETNHSNRQLLESQHLPGALIGLPIWAITTKSVRRAIPLVAGIFDLAIIDEAAQCDVSSVLPVLFRARRAMFVGDEKQLPSLASEQVSEETENAIAARHNLTAANLRPFLFRRKSAYSLGAQLLETQKADEVSKPILLEEHYRCHPEIAEFFSRACYEAQLVIRTSRGGVETPEGRGIRWSHVRGDGNTGLQGGSRWDPLQRDRIVEALQRLHDDGFEGTVGVVTPFHGHAKRIQDEVERRIPRSRLDAWDFLANTVDKFQGGERDLVLVGLVGGGVEHTPRFYQGEGAERRFNVAFSRAKKLLHIFGDKKWASNSGVRILEELVEYVDEVESMRARELRDPVRRELIGPVWEPALAGAMSARRMPFEQQYHACGFYLDFALFAGNGRKINVEVDGEQFHRDRDGRRKASDVRRDRILMQEGWTVTRFWVYELREDMDRCVGQIEKLLNESS